MYIQSLETPHPELRQLGVAPQPFVEAAGLLEARDYLANGWPNQSDRLFEVLDYISETVRQTLRYPNFDAESDMNENQYAKRLSQFDALEGLSSEQTTHCVGYTIAASECLDVIGVEHQICYMGGHWFLAVPYTLGGEDHLQLVDMYKPGKQQAITQDLSDVLRNPGVSKFINDVRLDGKSAAKVGVEDFAYNIGQTASSLAANYSWLEQYGRSLVLKPEAEGSKAFIVTAYRSDIGRPVLEAYTRFKTSLALGRTLEAASQLSILNGNYPEMDARAPHSPIQELVRNLCEAGYVREAAKSINDYFGFARISSDPRHSVAEGDLWRYVACQAHDPVQADYAKAMAMQSYKVAEIRSAIPSYRTMCLGKMAALSTRDK